MFACGTWTRWVKPLNGTRRIAHSIGIVFGLVAWGYVTELHAEQLFLLHGHLGRGSEWRVSGVAKRLVAAGWEDGGHIDSGQVPTARARAATRVFYTIDLPSEQGLEVQLSRIEPILNNVSPTREITSFAGFSAGGLVARLYMVRHPMRRYGDLITLASPHLGTASAELALQAGVSPLRDYADALGLGFINQSRALYTDLLPERPGRFLYQLNRLPHPKARYTALVRVNDEPQLGDLVVSVESQDMNNVAALHGRVRTLRIPGVHGLEPKDGELLARLLGSPE